MKLYLSLILTALLTTFIAAYNFYSLKGPLSPSEADLNKINKLKHRFTSTVGPIDRLNFSTLYYTFEHQKLIEPISSLKVTNFSSQSNPFITHDNCDKKIIKDLLSFSNFEKTLIWEDYRCHRINSLPSDFFEQPPYLHPAGSSYAYLAFALGNQDFQSEKWVREHLHLFHVTELAFTKSVIDRFEGVFKVLSELNREDLKYLNQGSITLLTKSYLLLKRTGPTSLLFLEYDIYPREALDSFLSGTPFVIKKKEEGSRCFYSDGSLCWNYNVLYLLNQVNQSSLFFLIAAIIFVTIMVWALLNKIQAQRLEDNRRRLALQVLTHEFRTPISSLLLNTEVLNHKFDSIPEEIQEPFLRLSGDVYRLQRLTEASKNYLSLASGKKLVNFNMVDYPSVNETIYSCIGRYIDEVSFYPLPQDVSFTIDSYWLGICLKNLIENSLNHGERPIEVRLQCSKKYLFITVQDLGECTFSSLEEMTAEFAKGNKSEGSGLGLNIVDKVIKDMGAELSFAPHPTRFTIKIKVKNGPDSID